MSQTPDRPATTTSLEPAAAALGAVVASDTTPLDTARPATFTGFRCSHCQSEDIQKLSVVYETGTSVINTRTTGSSTGFGIARGGIGVGTAFNSSRTSGTQSSALAQRAAPPPARMAFGWLVVGFAGFVVASMLFGMLAALLVVAGSGFFMYQGIKYNGGERQQLLAAWQQSWLCHRCGMISRISPR